MSVKKIDATCPKTRPKDQKVYNARGERDDLDSISTNLDTVSVVALRWNVSKVILGPLGCK